MDNFAALYHSMGSYDAAKPADWIRSHGRLRAVFGANPM